MRNMVGSTISSRSRVAALLVCALFVLGGRALAADYVLGMSAPFTGPSRGLGIELYRGAMAYFLHVNAQGGVAGRPVAIRALDDAYQPGPTIDNTIEFLRSPDVICLFGHVGTPNVTRVLPLLKGSDEGCKPLFFPFSGGEPHRRAPYADNIFNLRVSYRQEMEGLVERLVSLGRRRVAVFYQVDAFGRSGWEGLRLALAGRGLELAGEATYRRGAAFADSMAEQARILIDAQPDAVVCVGTYEACAALIRDARDQGLASIIVNLSVVGCENLLALLRSLGLERGRDYLADLLVTQGVPSYEDLRLPAVREYRALMDGLPRLLPSGADADYREFRYSFAGFEGYLDARLMTCILGRYAESPGRGLVGAAESLGEVDLGIGSPAYLGPASHQALSRVYFTMIREGRFVPVDERQWEAWQR
ncbi:MAG: ABC transporter substrate-binding protein [Pseudodesulfovibrio sp.]